MSDVIQKAFEILAQDSARLHQTTQAWNVVCQKIEERATKTRPKPKVYEVWHEIQIAREALLSAIAAGEVVENAKFIALDRMRIGYVRNDAGRFLRWKE